ncbi:MAG: hypothetical protein KAU16_00330 [Methanophagales archaeon]|nr:hypothetical protein [Methanophagales archaeon]
MLSEKKIEKMWQAYQEHQSAYFVAATCKVSPTTATNYRDSEHWDERLRKIREEAIALVDNKVARQLAKDIEVVHDLKMKIADAIQKQLEAGNYKPTVGDLERLVKLEHFLRGLPDSRTEEDVGSWKWLEEVNEDRGHVPNLFRKQKP